MCLLRVDFSFVFGRRSSYLSMLWTVHGPALVLGPLSSQSDQLGSHSDQLNDWIQQLNRSTDKSIELGILSIT